MDLDPCEERSEQQGVGWPTTTPGPRSVPQGGPGWRGGGLAVLGRREGDDDLESETENAKSDARGPHPGVVCSHTRS